MFSLLEWSDSKDCSQFLSVRESSRERERERGTADDRLFFFGRCRHLSVFFVCHSRPSSFFFFMSLLHQMQPSTSFSIQVVRNRLQVCCVSSIGRRNHMTCYCSCSTILHLIKNSSASKDLKYTETLGNKTCHAGHTSYVSWSKHKLKDDWHTLVLERSSHGAHFVRRDISSEWVDWRDMIRNIGLQREFKKRIDKKWEKPSSLVGWLSRKPVGLEASYIYQSSVLKFVSSKGLTLTTFNSKSMAWKTRGMRHFEKIHSCVSSNGLLFKKRIGKPCLPRVSSCLAHDLMLR
jgi:hypothetical protein